MDEVILIKAHMRSLGRLKDGSATMGFVTMEEADNEIFSLLDRFWQHNGWLMFGRNQLDPTNLPKENAEVKGNVSPSTFLRNCLYARHMKAGGSRETFQPYYERVMAQFAQSVINSFPGE